jgi:hypothetical protein
MARDIVVKVMLADQPLPLAGRPLDPRGHTPYIARHDDACCKSTAPPPPCHHGTGLTNVISVPPDQAAALLHSPQSALLASFR